MKINENTKVCEECGKELLVRNFGVDENIHDRPACRACEAKKNRGGNYLYKRMVEINKIRLKKGLQPKYSDESLRKAKAKV